MARMHFRRLWTLKRVHFYTGETHQGGYTMVLLHIHDVFFQSRDACHGNLSHEIVERVLHTSLSLSLSLLSENYDDALLFYTL